MAALLARSPLTGHIDWLAARNGNADEYQRRWQCGRVALRQHGRVANGRWQHVGNPRPVPLELATLNVLQPWPRFFSGCLTVWQGEKKNQNVNLPNRFNYSRLLYGMESAGAYLRLATILLYFLHFSIVFD